jgi:hypothetical protein
MPAVLQSRTTVGLLSVLLLACVFALLGKLTPELADILKFTFLTFAGSRTVTNVAETRVTKPNV